MKPYYKVITNIDPKLCKYNTNDKPAHAIQRSDTEEIQYTEFDDVRGGLRCMTEEEATERCGIFNAELGWKPGDQVDGEFVVVSNC